MSGPSAGWARSLERGVAVHLLDDVAVALLLLGEGAAEVVAPEQVSEQVGGGVGAFDVEQLQIGLRALPEVEADLRVALGRGDRPAQVGELLFEIEVASQVLVGRRGEAPQILERQGFRPDQQ